jgi:hypothetical protein
MITGRVTGGSGDANVIVCALIPIAKWMTSVTESVFACMIASRNVPAPLSLWLVTMIVAASAAGAEARESRPAATRVPTASFTPQCYHSGARFTSGLRGQPLDRVQRAVDQFADVSAFVGYRNRQHRDE